MPTAAYHCIFLSTDLVDESIGIQWHFQVLDLAESLLSILVEPVLLTFGYWELSLDYFVHRVLKSIFRCQSFETFMTAIVPQTWLPVITKGRLFKVEVGVRVDDIATLVALLGRLPGEVLKLGLDVPVVVAEDKLGSQLLSQKLLRWRHPGG